MSRTDGVSHYVEAFTLDDLPGYRCLNDSEPRALFHNDSVLADLLLDQDHLLSAVHNEIASWVKRTFSGFRHFVFCFVCEDTSRAFEHYW